MKMRPTVITAALLCLAIGLPGSNAHAQQRQQVSFKVQERKFPVSQNVDVGDVRNHQVRLFDTHLILPNPTINGLRLVEAFVRGTADYTGLVGGGVGYHMFVAENGDKIFTRNTLSIEPDQDNKATSTTVRAGQITGGTGKIQRTRRDRAASCQRRSQTRRHHRQQSDQPRIRL
jgi:hypothetical protein